MTTWQYKVSTWNAGGSWGGISGDAGVEAMLDSYGADGWELASSNTGDFGASFVFKRPTSN